MSLFKTSVMPVVQSLFHRQNLRWITLKSKQRRYVCVCVCVCACVCVLARRLLWIACGLAGAGFEIFLRFSCCSLYRLFLTFTKRPTRRYCIHNLHTHPIAHITLLSGRNIIPTHQPGNVGRLCCVACCGAARIPTVLWSNCGVKEFCKRRDLKRE